MRNTPRPSVCFVLTALLALTGCQGLNSSGRDRGVDAATIAEGRAAVQEIMASTKATSVSVALVDDGRLVWSEAFGVADKGSGRAATTDTLYSLASVSKTLAAASVMLLVDRGNVSLDEPVATYIPGFSMPLDPRYRDITVRMLLSHASGLPGNDSRGAVTTTPFPGYAAQVMDGLRLQRLKHDPGLLSSYNNDGFSMVENLVTAVTGQDYPTFVRENLLSPLGMNLSRYMVAPLPEGSYARSYAGDTLLPLCYYNVYATGGLFSTPKEMAQLAILFMNGGLSGPHRILSEQSVAAMGDPQRLGSFDPIPCSVFSFGLGWDSVAYPGPAAVGTRVWQKGGDLEDYYGATFMVAPEERLGVVVLGASNDFSSGAAAKIAERILLRALVEHGQIAAMPAQLTPVELPVQAMTPQEQAACTGIYASGTVIFRVAFGPDGALTVDKFGSAWTTAYKDFKLRSDGWFAADGDPLTGVRLFTRAGRAYLALRAKYGYGNYQLQSLYGQRLDAASPLSAPWAARALERWMPVNGDSTDFLLSAKDPSFQFRTVEGLDGYLLGDSLFRDFSPADGNRLDGMFLTLPDGVRDLQDASAETWNAETWLRVGTRLYRPLSTVPALPAGATTLTIGDNGFGEWRKLPASGRITLAGAGCWSLHGPDFAQLATGTGAGDQTLTGTGAKWLVVLGAKGTAITLDLATE